MSRADPAAPRRAATATDVARLAGVSQSAVSRAFTPGASIAEGTRGRVVEAARRLGYRPNAIARSLITRRSGLIGVAMAYLDNQFYPDVLEALSRALQARGFHILLFTAEKDRTADPMLEEILRYRVDGILLASTVLSSALAVECRAAGVPVVLFNRVSEAAGSVSSVVGENERGAGAIAAFLAAGGHRRPAYIAGIEASSTNRARERGFFGWFAEAGRPEPARVVGHYSYAGAAAAARSLLRGPDRPPDAVFAANDHMAIAAVEVARHELGLRVPEDLSVVGFDDVAAARWPSYALTSFAQPIEPMVEAAVAILAELVDEPERPPRHETVPGELVVRGSARLPPGGVVERGGRRVWTGQG